MGGRQAVQLRLVSGRERRSAALPGEPAHQDRRAFGCLKIDGMSTLSPAVWRHLLDGPSPTSPSTSAGDEADVAGFRDRGIELAHFRQSPCPD